MNTLKQLPELTALVEAGKNSLQSSSHGLRGPRWKDRWIHVSGHA